MIDFRKLASANDGEAVTEPRKIFGTLPKKNPKFKFLHDVQADVLAQWFDRRGEKDTVIKMNTGSGKTLVALLTLQSSLNESIGPAVYVAPNNFLVQQVIEEAKALGIAAVPDENAPDFRAGHAILIVNVHKLFNGLSVFGVGDRGVRIPIGSIVIDDAHACLATIRDQFTAKLPSSHDAYGQLLDVVRPALEQQSRKKLLDVESEDPQTTMLVPFWSWQEHQARIAEILHEHRFSDELKFSWPLFGDVLEDCRCAIGAGKLEIAPICLPIDLIPSFDKAKRRIHTTATLADDSVLVTEFAANPEWVSKPITPQSASDIGDRMILAPQEIIPTIAQEDVKEFLTALAEDHNVIVIVPSQSRSEFWRDAADQILMSEEISKGVQRLQRNEHVGLTVLVNRYDGIDLPGDACRVLVLDGIPHVGSLLDKMDAIALYDTDVEKARVVHKIEQGMGRGIRSNDDYCVVFLMGPHLAARLQDPSARNEFTPGTLAQFKLSQEVAAQMKNASLQELRDTINYCLNQDEEWVSASKRAVVSSVYEGNIQLDELAIRQREAFNYLRTNQFREAQNAMQLAVDACHDPRIKGWLMAQMAQIANRIDPVQAQHILGSALQLNKAITRSLEGIAYSRISELRVSQSAAAAEYFRQNYSNGSELLVAINPVIADIRFAPDSAKRFEQALKIVGQMLGFESQRPEADYGAGPDNLWAIGEQKFLVIECKNEAVTSTIPKRYADQLSGSVNWFYQKYGESCSAYPILVHPSRKFTKDASPASNTRIMPTRKLTELTNSLSGFVKALASNDSFRSPDKISESLNYYKLTGDSIVHKYTLAFKNEK